MLLRLLYPVTRNSAIADKPHDAFVQYAMAWLTPPPPLLNTSLLICVTTLNLVILRQGVRITKATQKWGAMGPRVLGRGVPGLLQTRPSSVGYQSELDHCWSNGTSIHMERPNSTGKKWVLVSRFLKSLKVIGNDG